MGLVRRAGIYYSMDMKMDIKVLDLFSGGGGSSWGAYKAGATIACGIDAWEIASSVYNDNFPGCAVNATITSDSDPRDVQQYGPFDLILASPECTNHSCARGNRPKDEASRMTASHVLNYIRHFEPRWVVIENVVNMKGWDKYDDLLDTLQAMGYEINEQILDASHFGVPQSRRRLFILCDRLLKPLDVNPTTELVPPSARTILDPPGTWKTSPLITPKRAKPTIERALRAQNNLPPGEDFIVVYYGSDAAGGWQSLDKPLRTLTTLDRFGLVEHGPEGLTLRMLQVPELQRAMGLDPEFRIECGTRRNKVKLLGNGVCAPVMQAIVETLISREYMPSELQDSECQEKFLVASCG